MRERTSAEVDERVVAPPGFRYPDCLHGAQARAQLCDDEAIAQQVHRDYPEPRSPLFRTVSGTPAV